MYNNYDVLHISLFRNISICASDMIIVFCMNHNTEIISLFSIEDIMVDSKQDINKRCKPQSGKCIWTATGVKITLESRLPRSVNHRVLSYIREERNYRSNSSERVGS